MDDYYQEDESIYAKTISQNFCAISWAGESEGDVPKVYYFNTGVQNQLPCESDQRNEVIIQLVQKTIGLAIAINNITGPSLCQNSKFQTTTFQSDRSIISVRQVYRYHIIVCVQQPCSNACLNTFVDLVMQIMCQNADLELNTTQDTNQAPPAPFLIESIQHYMLDAAFCRFSEDISARNFLLTAFHTAQLPRDTISVTTSVVSTVEYVAEHLNIDDSVPVAHIVLHGDRCIFTTTNPFTTNYLTLYVNFLDPVVDLSLNSVLNSGPAQTYYLTIFKQYKATYILVSQTKLELNEDFGFKSSVTGRLGQINVRMEQFFDLPKLYTNSLDQLAPVSLPMAERHAVAGVDAGMCFYGFKAINSVNIVKKQAKQENLNNFGVDGWVITFALERPCLCIVSCTMQHIDYKMREFDRLNEIILQNSQTEAEEFYAFPKTYFDSSAFLDSGVDLSEIPLIYGTLKDKQIVSTGVVTLHKSRKESINKLKECFRIQLRTEWNV